MNEQQAKWLLDETFNQEFDVIKFSNFLKELVNNSNLYVQEKTQFIPGEFRDYILKVEKLGQYKDKAGKSMELLAIKLAKHSSLERAIRNIIEMLYKLRAFLQSPFQILTVFK